MFYKILLNVAIFIAFSLYSSVHVDGNYQNTPYRRSDFSMNPFISVGFALSGANALNNHMKAADVQNNGGSCGFNPLPKGAEHSGDEVHSHAGGSGSCNIENTVTTTPKIKITANERVVNIFRNADAICLDVDSTAITNEGIDEFAAFCGKGDEVKNITEEAMRGKLNFIESLEQRMKIISPRWKQLQGYVQTRPMNLTKNVKELVDKLHKRDKQVYLVSGGFSRIVGPVAFKLGIRIISNIFANTMQFTRFGEYKGLDKTEIMSNPGGKGLVVKELKDNHGHRTVVMIGDGVIDAEARPPADLFICFGGNVVREEAKAKADWFITDFQELIDVL